MKTTRSQRWISGMTLPEVMVAMSISAVVIGAILIGSVTVQRTNKAAEAYAEAQAEQMRVLDYIAMDARRAVLVESPEPSTLILRIPDYYQNGQSPQVINLPPKRINNVYRVYGNQWVVVRYQYRPQEKDIIRNYNGVESVLVSNVADMKLLIDRAQDPVITVNIQFTPEFHRSSLINDAAPRAATTATVTTMMRNSQKITLN